MINSFYKLPFKKHMEPKRKSDTIIAYEVQSDRKQPLNVVYLTKERIPVDLTDEDEIDKFEKKLSIIKTDNEKSKFQPVPIVKHNELNAISVYVSGPSGSGKSYYVANLVNNIKTLDRFKDSDIFLITGQIKPDKAYEDHIDKYMKINMDSEEFYTLTYSDF